MQKTKMHWLSCARHRCWSCRTAGPPPSRPRCSLNSSVLRRAPRRHTGRSTLANRSHGSDPGEAVCERNQGVGMGRAVGQRALGHGGQRGQWPQLLGGSRRAQHPQRDRTLRSAKRKDRDPWHPIESATHVTLCSLPLKSILQTSRHWRSWQDAWYTMARCDSERVRHEEHGLDGGEVALPLHSSPTLASLNTATPLART